MANVDQVLLFDGICNLCNRLVIFLIKRDQKSKFKFAPLQSSAGQILLKKLGLSSNNINTLVYIKGEKYYLKSSAVLHVLKDLGGIWKNFFIFILVPRFIRDALYNLTAKWRYRIMGKRESCIIPDTEIRNKFIS